mgnify:CR=1 FL=1
MRAAFTATELATLRSRPQAVTYHLAVHQPRVVWSGNMGSILPNTFPGSAISASGTSQGHLSNVLAGMTLRIGTEPNLDDLGTIRVRRAPTASNIPIAAFSSGLINWRTNACLTILSEYRPWPIHQLWDVAASAWYVDFDAYTSQLRRYGPQAVLGPPAVLWMDAGTGRATASYVGDRSYTHTVGASITSQSWSFPNGQTVTSLLGSSNNPIVITYTNTSSGGDYHTLTVTDGNGNSHIGQRLTFVFNTSNVEPIKVRFDEISGGLRRGGYETRVYISGSNTATSSQFPDGAQVVIFEKASYGGIASSIGGNFFNRNNVVLVGWIQGESIRIEPFTGEVSFNIRTLDGELENTLAYDLFLESGSAASAWDMASGLTVDRAGVALTKYRATIANITDFYLAESYGSSLEIPYRSLPVGNLWEQLRYNYEAVNGIVATDLQSSIYAQVDSQVSGGSGGLPTIMDIASRDRRDQVVIEREKYRQQTSQYLIFAIQSGTSPNNPLGAYSAENPAGYFGGRQEIQRNRATPSQDVLITWAGNMQARDNNPYKRVSIPLSGNIRLDSVPQSRITMSLSPNDVKNLRGLNWNNKVLLPVETSISYKPEGGFANVDIVAEATVDGIGGSAFTYPRASQNNIEFPNPPPLPIPPPPGDTGPSDGNTVYMLVGDRIGRTITWNSDPPNWTNITGSASIGSGRFRDFILDPYNPKNVAYVATTTRIYKCTNLNSGSPTWTQILQQSDLSFSGTFVSFRRLKANITAQNNIAVVFEVIGAGVLGNDLYMTRTTNAGTSWTTAVNMTLPIGTFSPLTITTKHATRNNSQFVFDWAQSSTNIMYTSYAAQLSDATFRSGVLYSNDSGTTWQNRDITQVSVLQNPYDLTIVYSSVEDINLTSFWYIHDGSIKRVFNSQSETSVNYLSDDDPDAPISCTYKISPFNSYSGCYVWDSTDSAGGVGRLRYTNDGGASWETRYTTTVNNPGNNVGLWPYDSNRIYAILSATGPVFSLDGGYTFSAKMGDWESAVGTWDAADVANNYGVVVVPVWTE